MMEALQMAWSLPSQQVDILSRIDAYRVSKEVQQALDARYNTSAVFQQALSATDPKRLPSADSLQGARIQNLGVLGGAVLEFQDGAARGHLVKGAFKTVYQKQTAQTLEGPQEIETPVPNVKMVAVSNWPLWMASDLVIFRADKLVFLADGTAGPKELSQIANPLRVVVSERGREEIEAHPDYYTRVVVAEEKLWEVPGKSATDPLEERFLPVSKKLDLHAPLDSLALLAKMEENELESMLEQLFRLNQTMRITDLHLENVVLTNEAQPKLACIDLEPIGGLYDRDQKSRAVLRSDRWSNAWDPRVFGIIGIRKYQLSAEGFVEHVKKALRDGNKSFIEKFGQEVEAVQKLNRFLAVVNRVADREVNSLTSKYKKQYAVRYAIRLAALYGAFKLFEALKPFLPSLPEYTIHYVKVGDQWIRVNAPAA